MAWHPTTDGRPIDEMVHRAVIDRAPTRTRTRIRLEPSDWRRLLDATGGDEQRARVIAETVARERGFAGAEVPGSR